MIKIVLKGIRKLHKFFYSVNWFIFIIVLFALLLLTKSFFVGVVFQGNFTFPSGLLYLSKNTKEYILKALIWAPIGETILFQSLPIRLLLYLLKKVRYKELYACVISSIIFGSLHYYSFYYIILAFFLGLILAYAYVLSIKRKEKPILNVALIHFLNNFLAFIVLRTVGIY